MHVYIFIQKDGKAVKDVHGEVLAFETMIEAKRKKKEWSELGEMHVYGNDTFYVRNLKILMLS